MNTISDATVRKVREQYADGATQYELSKRFDVAQGWVSKVVNGRLRVAAGGPIASRRGNNRRVAS